MSYNLVVFRPEAAFIEWSDFMDWYEEQIKWKEGKVYNDLSVCSFGMQNWFKEMIVAFPDVSAAATDNENAAEYKVDKDIIFVCFPESLTKKAYGWSKSLAAKHEIGFFDLKTEVLFPDGTGRQIPINKPGKPNNC